MSETGKKAAWKAFREPILRVVGCIDQTARPKEHTFASGVRFLGGKEIPFGDALHLSFAFHLEHGQKDGVDRMTTLRYEFTLTDQATRRVFAWHWHPESKRSRVIYPHLHMPKGTPHAKAHVPTGRVTLEEVVLFGFHDLGVEPAVENGLSIVEQAMGTHKKYRAWN